MPQQFFYDNNIRKWVLQLIRLFSGFTVQYGLDSNGNQLYSTVPVIWGDGTFSAATIQKLNTENMMPSAPMMSLYISNMKYDRSRVQDPTYVDVKSVRTRAYDSETGRYLPQQANAYTVKRFMPVPYNLDIKLDIVTTNTQQKLQILEQLLPLFNPALEIQKTDNYLDWESLSYLEMKDTTWSNRTIPVGQGSDTTYDICTLQFETPIWMSLPAQVSKMGVIFKVINNINATTDLQDLVYGTRQVITYNNYGIYVQNGQIRILNQGVSTVDGPINESLYGQPQNWSAILDAYGNIRSGVSQIGLTYDNSSNEILGTISISPSDPTILLYNVDASTLPSNTLPAINAIVNPQIQAPGYGLPAAEAGQSYLLTANIGPVEQLGTSSYISQVPFGNIDGTNNVFTTSFEIANTATLVVTLNGQILMPSVDYTVSNQTITLTAPPQVGDFVFAYYLYNPSAISTGFINTVPTGPIDGTNTAFAIPSLPIPANSLNVWLNGLLLVQGTDYSIIGDTITMLTFVPQVTDSLLATYRNGAVSNMNFSYIDGEVPSGIANGTNRVFSLSYTPLGLQLFYNGALLSQGSDYNLVGNTITYLFFPGAGEHQLAYYAYNANGSGSWPYGQPNSEAEASVNDIITYSGTAWVTTFSAVNNTSNIQFVFDTNSNLQYQWNGNAWVAGWEGPYTAANWRLIV